MTRSVKLCGCPACAARDADRLASYASELDAEFLAVVHESFGADEEANLRLLADSLARRTSVADAVNAYSHFPPVSP